MSAEEYEDNVSSQLAAERQQRLRQRAGLGASVTSDDDAKQKAIQLAKDQVKKRIIMWVLSTLAAIFLNPVTWMIIGGVFIALVGYWCSVKPIDCVKDLGFGVGFNALLSVIKAIIE